MKNKFYIIEDRSDRALRYFGKEGINALKQTDGVIILSSLPTPLSEIEDGLIIFAHKSLLVSTGQLGTLCSYAQEKRKYRRSRKWTHHQPRCTVKETEKRSTDKYFAF